MDGLLPVITIVLGAGGIGTVLVTAFVTLRVEGMKNKAASNAQAVEVLDKAHQQTVAAKDQVIAAKDERIEELEAELEKERKKRRTTR